MIARGRAVAVLVAVFVTFFAVSTAAQDRGANARLAPDSSRIVYAISPHDTDPAITRYDEANIVIYRNSTPTSAPLLVFMPGTSGRPQNLLRFLDAASSAGYRSIGLMYNDFPAVNVVCPRDPDPQCNSHFRQKSIYGDGVTNVIDVMPAESIVNRLIKLLQYLAAQHPRDGWDEYVAGGKLNWARIALGGHSQGAGMAAFIAKDHEVFRVILFSSPWDFHAPDEELAAWLSQPSATPLDRWYAAYHTREPMAALIQRAYAALGIPPSNIRALSLDPQTNSMTLVRGAMIYHTSVVGDLTTPISPNGEPAYLPEWRFMLGNPAEAPMH